MARADSSNDFRTLKHHDEYYLTGGDLYFLVEQYLFRVHKYFFERESLYFKQELGTPASPGETRRGSSEGNAIILKDVTHREFAKFLWVFYNPRYSIYAADWEDWTDILKLAQRWSFSEVKDLAIRELENLDMPDVERVHFYQEYAVDRRLLIARYAALTERADPLTFDEGIRLGIATSLMIARARECVRSPVQAGIRSPISPSVDADEMNVIIKDLFNISDGPAYTPIEQFRPSPFVKASGGLTAYRRTGPRLHQSLSASGAPPQTAAARHSPPPPQPLVTPRMAQETRPPTPPLSPETEETTTTPQLDGSPSTPRPTDAAHLPSTEGVEQVGLGEEKTVEVLVGEGEDEISRDVHESKLPETPNTNEANVEQEDLVGGKIDAEQEEVKQHDHVTEGTASGITDKPQEISTSEEAAPATTPVIVSPSSAGASDNPWDLDEDVETDVLPSDTATTPVVASSADGPGDSGADIEAGVPPVTSGDATPGQVEDTTVADVVTPTDPTQPITASAPDDSPAPDDAPASDVTPAPDTTLAEAASRVEHVADVATSDNVAAPKDALPPQPPSSDVATTDEPGHTGDVADPVIPDVDLSKLDEVPSLSSPAAAQAPPPIGTGEQTEPNASSTSAENLNATTLPESRSTATGQPAQVSAPAEVKPGEDVKSTDLPRTRKTSETIPSATPLARATPARSTSVSESGPPPWPAPPSPEHKRFGTGLEDGAQWMQPQPGGSVHNAFTNARSPQAGERPLEMPGGMGPRPHGPSNPTVTNPYTNVTSPQGGLRPLDNSHASTRPSAFSSPLKAHSPAFVPRQHVAPPPPPPPPKKSSGWFSGIVSAVTSVVQSPAQTSPPPINRSPTPPRGQHFEHQQYSQGPQYRHQQQQPPPHRRQAPPEPPQNWSAPSHSTTTASSSPNPPVGSHHTPSPSADPPPPTSQDADPKPAPSTDAPTGGEPKPELTLNTDIMWPDGTKDRFVPSATSLQAQTASGSGAKSGVEALGEIKEDEPKGVEQSEPATGGEVAGDQAIANAGDHIDADAGGQTESKEEATVDEQNVVDHGSQEATQTASNDETHEGEQVETTEPEKSDTPVESEKSDAPAESVKSDAPAEPGNDGSSEEATQRPNIANADGQPQTDAAVNPESETHGKSELEATVDAKDGADSPEAEGVNEIQDAAAAPTKPEVGKGQDTSTDADSPEERKLDDVEERQAGVDSAPASEDKAQLDVNAPKPDDTNTPGDQDRTQQPQKTDDTAKPVESNAEEQPDKDGATEPSGNQPTPTTPQVDDDAEFAGMSKTQIKKLKRKRKEDEEKRLKEEQEKKEGGEGGDEVAKRKEEELENEKRRAEEEMAKAKAKEEEEKAAKAKEAQSKADSEAAKKTAEKPKSPTNLQPQQNPGRSTKSKKGGKRK